jgi:hypothetical protein
MNWRNKLHCLVVVSAILGAPEVFAGKSCEETTMGADKTSEAFDAGLRLQNTLNTGGQKVLILARRGQNLEKYGVTFSHAAFAVRAADGRGWSVFHDLNTCGSASAKLFEQGLADFLADDLYSNEVAMVVPEDWLQDRLLQILSSGPERFLMHEAHYSAVAYPFSIKYQNSNGWLLETYARAAADVKLSGRADAQSWLKANQYVPSILNLGPLTRLGGRVFKANVAFDDHPDALRWNNRITVNTGDDVLRFVSKHAIPQPQCAHGQFSQSVCISK